ncbi:sensor histidine kinase [Piscinibacter sakaiensis]|uniref:histidine kinase n=1 Tax=Piscinibacter sakaiensis TaxID=1547922 RepID=A0A0K8NVQ0_PISS1|nr:sensor histidine kinase [Piscinibacter sakaiensis]GAP34354.1 periplasmic sensor signal transduction histidine kinase [Piscinibacter sakaiensis]
MSLRTRWSLRRTLLAGLLLPLVVLVPLAALLLHGLAVRPALDGLDRALTDTAVALQGILAEAPDGPPRLPLSAQTERALRADLVDQVAFAVLAPDGTLLGGDAELRALRPPLAVGAWRFFDARLAGRPVRVAAHGASCGTPPGTCTVLVAESLGKRDAAARAVLLASLAAALLLAVSLWALAVLAVRRGLRPLDEAAAALDARSPDGLSPIDPAGVPREVAPFLRALNALFERLRQAGATQRAFVADASHQLRTPLATLLSESAQALEQPHPESLRPRLQRLHAAATRAAHLAQQLLTLARIEGAGLAMASRQRCDLAALARDGAQDWLAPSLAAGQDLGFGLEPAPVDGDPLLLREAMDNLVRNALQHAGAGARVTLRTGSAGGQALLEVEDDGPGLPADERERVWDRFHRGRGAAAGGTGLGLAIVRDIARLHGGDARLEAGPEGRGLVARMVLPRGS